jgi:hypothetical protein
MQQCPSRQRVGEWREDSPHRDDFMALVDRIGKGRLAQRLAHGDLKGPRYVIDALRYLADE